MVIRRTDRISRVLQRDEALVETLAAASPHFEKLRNPSMRRVMAGLVTVEQAARIAGIDPEDLVRRLNERLAGGPAAPDADGDLAERRDSAGATGSRQPEREESPALTHTMPAVDPLADPTSAREADGEATEVRQSGDPDDPVAGPSATAAQSVQAVEIATSAVPRDRIVDLDVREDLRNGREPFTRIMAARQALGPDQALRLRATFEPVPLYGVMARFGFAHRTERLAEDDWHVLFYREAAGGAPHERGEADGVTSKGANADSPLQASVPVRTAKVLREAPGGRRAEPRVSDDGRDDGPVRANHHSPLPAPTPMPVAPGRAAPPPDAIHQAGPEAADLPRDDTADPELIVLDVRGMEPPEPMVHTLAALETLPAGATLLQINERVPQFLLPRLEQLGFQYEIRPQRDDLVRVFIRRPDGG